MSDDRPVAYVEGGVLVIRASALGMCPRALWAAADGVEQVAYPDFMTDAARRGELYEAAMMNKLMGEGVMFKSSQDLVELVIIPGKLIIRGHTDGVIMGDPDELLEIKSMSGRVFEEWMANGFLSKPGYAWQLSVYMLATGLPARYICVRAHPEANDLGQAAINRHVLQPDTAIDERLIRVPPKNFDEVKAKALEVFKAWKRGEMPDCPEEVYPCPVFFLHDEDPVDNDETRADYLEGRLAAYVVLSDEIKERQTAQKELRKELLAELPDGETLAGGYRAKVTARKGRVTLDKARMKADGIDLSEYEKVGKPTRALSVEKGET